MKVRGQGTIVALEKPERTCRKWQLRVSVGYDWGSKQYKTKTRRVSGTKTEAKAELRNFIAELEGTSVLDANTVTLGSYAEDWLEARKSQPQPPRAGTMRNNSVAVRTIQKGLGSERLIDLDFNTVADFYRRLMAGECSLSGKPVSGTTARKVSVVLHQILKRAVRQGLIQSNPCDQLESVEKPSVDTAERRPLSDDEARRLVAALYAGDPDAHKVGAALALECGLRREEVLGLSWDDVDLEHGLVHVRHAYTSDELSLQKPKSAAGDRMIPINPAGPLCSGLKRWHELQSESLGRLGLVQERSTPIVTSSTGGHIHPNNFSRWWYSFCKKAGIPRCGFHALRHTYATSLGRSGTDPKTLQYLLGDSTGTIALKIYEHYSSDNGRSAMEGMSRLLHGTSPEALEEAAG
jgi:integrase